MEETISTRQLALNTIEHIGSTPKYTEEGRIQFEYQGVIFLMEAVNDCAFVDLIWPWCHSFSKFDIDEFARVRQVVNDINARGGQQPYFMALQIRMTWQYISRSISYWYRRFQIWRGI